MSWSVLYPWRSKLCRCRFLNLSCLFLIWSECGLSQWLYHQGFGQKVLTKTPLQGDIRWPGIEGAWRPFHSQRRLVRRVKRWTAELRRKKVIFRFWRQFMYCFTNLCYSYFRFFFHIIIKCAWPFLLPQYHRLGNWKGEKTNPAKS